MTGPADARKRMSDLWASLNNDAEMKDLAAKSGFELVNIGVDLTKMTTVGDLQGGIEEAERLLGYKVAALKETVRQV